MCDHQTNLVCFDVHPNHLPFFLASILIRPRCRVTEVVGPRTLETPAQYARDHIHLQLPVGKIVSWSLVETCGTKTSKGSTPTPAEDNAAVAIPSKEQLPSVLLFFQHLFRTTPFRQFGKPFTHMDTDENNANCV